MKIRDLIVEADKKNDGRDAAGILVIRRDSGRLLLQKRGTRGDHAGEWRTFGGHIKEYETPEQGAERELREETKVHPKHLKLIPFHKSHHDGMTYFTFVGLVDREFTPKLDMERAGFRWFYPRGEFPKPLHPDFRKMIQKSDLKQKLLKYRNHYKREV